MSYGKLIGIVGHAGAGKTTLTASALARWNGPRNVVHMNFSRPIVRMLAAMGVPQGDLDNKKCWNDPQPVLNGHSIRHAATTLGTEWGRNYLGSDVWTQIAMIEANAKRRQGRHVIIDNVRYPSEFLMLQAEGAKFIALYRRDHTGNLAHSSEQHISELQKRCDAHVTNIGSFDETADLMHTAIMRLIGD